MCTRLPLLAAITSRIASGALALLCVTPAMGVTEIRTAAQETSEPKFIILKQDGKAVIDGLCIDIMRAIEQVEPNLKFIIEQELQSLMRLESSLATGKLDAACGVMRTKEREARFTYIEPALFPVKFYLAVRANDDIKINSWDDVRKLGDQGIILMISGHGSIKKLQALGGLRIDSGAKDPRTNIQKLIGGRGRFFFHRSPGIREEIELAGAKDKVKVLPTVMDSQRFYMAMSKNTPVETVDKMRKAIIRLENSGELKKLLDKWDGD